MILGDNIFFGSNLSKKLEDASNKSSEATVFLYHVNDPENYGVINLDDNKNPISIIEKPKVFLSNLAVTGLYFYDKSAIEYAKKLAPSDRGELEITDINKVYLDNKKLNCHELGRGFAWLDTGTHDNLLHAADFVSTIQMRQGLMIACPEEIAYTKGWISHSELAIRILKLKNTKYGNYLEKIANDK